MCWGWGKYYGAQNNEKVGSDCYKKKIKKMKDMEIGVKFGYLEKSTLVDEW